MNTIGKLFVSVIALTISIEGFAADATTSVDKDINAEVCSRPEACSGQKVTSEDVRKALQSSRLCSAGDPLVGQSNLGQLYALSLEYLDARRATILEDEHIYLEWSRQAPELPSRNGEFLLRKLSNWNLSENYAIVKSYSLLYNGGLLKRLAKYNNLIFTDWDRFFVDFVNEQKTKIGYPDVGCFHYSSQRTEAP